MRALVTGGRGFVGGWLAAHLLAEGDEVVVIDHEVDVTDQGAVRAALRASAPDVIYHLAALAHVGRSWEDPAGVLQVNTMGTFHVLEAARACSPPPTVLMVSSAEVYGTVVESQLPLGEPMPLAPVTPYAASKAAAEMLCVQAHLGHGLPVVRVRPFNHIGPGQSRDYVVAALAARIVEAQRIGLKEVAVGNMAARRDLTDVRDVVRAYRLLVCHGIPGEVYNVCSGRDVAIAEVGTRLLDLAGTDLRLVVDPELVRPVEIPVFRGDPSKLQATTGWQPAYELSDSLRDVLDYWRAQAP